MPLAGLAAALGGAATADVHVSGVCLDSRTVRPGDLYAALPGANAHGASFAAGAAERGAAAVLTDPAGAALLDDAGVDLPRVVVPAPRAVLGAASALVYGTGGLDLTTVGITGTNGKTTTAYLIDSALRALGESTGLIGTVETRVGQERIKSVRTTPESTDLHALLAVMAERGVATCVMEVSSHALSQHRVDGVVYDVALFTNLSQDHLDFHPTMEDYFAAKADLFTPDRSRRGIVCVDDEWGVRLAGQAGVPVETLASRPGVEADWVLRPDATDEQAFTLVGPVGELALRSALPGDFNRTNTALAAITLFALGHDQAAVERAMAADPHVPGRMEPVRVADAPDGLAERLPLVVVDYAHTPDAVEAALRALRGSTPGALVVVVGAGGDRDRGKRPAMGAAAARGADIVMVTNDNPRSEDPAAIREAVLAGAREAATSAELHDVEKRSLAIRRAVAAAYAAGPGSAVAVVGKGHETGQDVGGQVLPFDDREHARAALEELVAQIGAAE
ncbi:MAG: UDP-N-acetylmuramoyl-L-alanyl-D-glutamate--2,6-diaminopimelate ligase [Micrococcales bacterium]|nr:UDP-N-acetylmuramoyl-L-alanyl-D-glutamate--2,6-diaminopimelate ligase [Micrococcales bacterium]